MAMMFVPVVLFMVLSSGMDAVDVVDLGLYFKSHQVEYTADALLLQLDGKPVKTEKVDLSKEIDKLQNGTPEERKKAREDIVKAGRAAKPWLDKLKNSDDPQLKVTAEDLLKRLETPNVNKNIHKLLVIRALGELKSKESVVSLKKIASGKNIGEAWTAQKALAKITGNPLPKRPVLSPGDEMKWIPDNCGLILRNRITESKPILNPTEMMGMMGGMMGPGSGGNPMEVINQHVLKLMADTGYFRIDDVMFALADNVGDKTGFVAFLIKGVYDKKSVFSYLKNSFGLHTEKISGFDVLSRESFVMALIDDTKIIIFAGPDRKSISADKFLGNYKMHLDKKTVSGTVSSADWAKALLKDVDVTSEIWGICRLSDGYKTAPPLKPFDTAILKSSKTEKGENVLTLTATGKDNAAIKAVTDNMAKELEQAKKQMAGAIAMMPQLKNFVDIMNSTKLTAADKTATLTINCKEYSPSGMWLGTMMPYFMMARQMNRPMPPPQ